MLLFLFSDKPDRALALAATWESGRQQESRNYRGNLSLGPLTAQLHKYGQIVDHIICGGQLALLGCRYAATV